MTYMIDGRRLSQMTRDRLLRLCQSVHERLIEAREGARIAEAQRDKAINAGGVLRGELDMAKARRDQAVAELDATMIDRDHYKKESTNNWLKLEAALADVARRDGTVAAQARDILALRKKLSWWALFENIWTAAFWLCITASLGGWLLWLR